ncbi:MAG: hypothetical protein LBU67_08530, partial [Oscillospiraceae bacterium]|nr:hypothetical protein [Oscillospiraceae bacterium]
MSRRARHSQAPSSPRPQAEQRGLAGLSAQQWLCGVMVFCQVWIYAYSMLEDQTGTAAWWALAFAPLGGAVVWLPVALLLRACPGRGLCGALRQALPPLAGSLVCAWLGLLLAADGVTALCSLCNLASMTLLQDVDEKTVAFFTGAGLTLLLWAGDVTAASRLAVLLRGALLIGVTAMCVGLLT